MVLAQPGGVGQVESQYAVEGRAMIAFANVNQPDHTSWLILHADPTIRRTGLLRGRNGDADGIPVAFRWRPTATAGVAEIAESLQNVLRRDFVFVQAKFRFLSDDGFVGSGYCIQSCPR